MTARMGALAGIGNTPIVRMSRLATDDMAEVWVKLEAANPTGSYKDRMALAMIEGAERRGELQPGQAVVEYTGGSTGSSLAFVCAVTGHPLRIVTSDAFAPEKIATMRAFGADLEVIASPDGIHPELVRSMMRRADQIVEEEGAHATNQFHNRDMLDGYHELGEEITRQLDGPVAAFCSYVGTAGCLVGVTRSLAPQHPGLQRVAIEPTESAVLSGEPPGTHRIEGGGAGFVPPLLSSSDFDRVETVSTDQASDMARRLARTEGIFSGPSTGANVVVALRLATELGPGHRVVTVQCDSGLKYLGGDVHRS